VIKTTLVAPGCSEHAKAATGGAIWLAQRFHATLIGLHISELS